jgi:hypothetical protein
MPEVVVVSGHPRPGSRTLRLARRWGSGSRNGAVADQCTAAIGI